MSKRKEIIEPAGIVGRPVKLNKHSTDVMEKKLIPIGDLHYGAPNCNVEKVRKMIEYCRESDAWVILMGDLFEAATKLSVGAGVYEQVKTPQQQLDDLCEMFEPIKSQIIGALLGNHEFRLIKETSVDMIKILCKQLDIRYLGYQMNNVLKVGNQRYIVHATHGATGATLQHTKIKKVLDIARWNQADLYLYAHTHSLEVKSDEYRVYDSKNKVMTTRKRYYVLTGSFLEYDGSYAEMKNYQPEKTGVAKIKLFGDRHDIHIST